MHEMKDSCNQWIGLIPAKWKMKRLKYCADLYTGNSIKDEEKNKYEDSAGARPYISSKDINKTFSTIDYENGLYVKHNDFNFRIARKHDVLMCIEGGSAGKKKAILSMDVCFVNKLCCIHPKTVSHSFLFYFLQSPSFEDEFTYNITGMIGGVSVSKLSNFAICVPSLHEQEKIADYLDHKCGEIDSVMADLQEQIDKLEQYKRSIISETVTKGLNQKAPMKDSSISWVGMIPANWGVKRGKYIFSYIQKPTREDDGVITCFRDGEVTLRSNRREDGFTMSDKEIGYQGIDVGDLIIHGMDGFAGAIGISDSRGKASPVLNVLETNQSKRYFMYLLRTMAYKGVFEALSTGIRVRTCDTNWGKIKNIFYIVPPVEEQMCIVNYIDDKCAEIESIIADKKQQLEVVENYKKSLIYEYVTGKKEVVDE